jgi:NAD(P)-dependent dehydrogenase (short-subunit alcohol dehydrogenase family)
MSYSRDFEGRSALVTGGGRGIGLACARMLAERGARVAILGDDADVLSGAAAQARADSLDIIPIPADVRQEKEVAGAVSAVVEHFGTIRILINNAAIQPYGTVDATPPLLGIRSSASIFVGPISRPISSCRICGRAAAVPS